MLLEGLTVLKLVLLVLTFIVLFFYSIVAFQIGFMLAYFKDKNWIILLIIGVIGWSLFFYFLPFKISLAS